jgi:hypothetical protein
MAQRARELGAAEEWGIGERFILIVEVAGAMPWLCGKIPQAAPEYCRWSQAGGVAFLRVRECAREIRAPDQPPIATSRSIIAGAPASDRS